MKFRKAQGAAAKPQERDRRLSIFLWAALISFICGVIEFGQPLEDVIQAARDSVRSQPAEQHIVVAGIDDKTIHELGGSAYPRIYDAQAIDRLIALGANRVLYDRVFADPTSVAQDAAFDAALRRHPGRVFIGTMSPKDMTTGKYVEVWPQPQFMKSARLISLNGKTSPFGFSARLPFRGSMEKTSIPSMSTVLANKDIRSQAFYKPDWSIEARTIPTISVTDIVHGRVTREQVAGKDIVVGITSPSGGDIHSILHQGWLPGVYFHVIGAQTLERGTPVYWEWIPAFIVAIGLSLANLYARRRLWVLLSAAAAVVILGLFPLYLDEQLITVDVVPGALLFTIVAYRAMTLRRVQRSSETNLISGLPNLVALHQAGQARPATLVALKMQNFAEIAASFDQNIERSVIDEIRRRIMLSDDADQIFHGEDTLFWLSPLPMGEELAHHLEGLKAILSSALQVGDREIDLSISFGVDADHERPMASRVGSAILCAEEAAAAGDVWKFYDPQRRHEAAWQLSLLSRLDLGIDQGEVWVAYQPQLHLQSNRIESAEALVRWTHPERGLIGPDEFIALAEKHNRIEKLTGFVLDQAIAAAAQINAHGTSFSIAVNLPVQMLQVPHLIDTVEEVLARHDFPASQLILEVTETGKLDRNGPSIAMMKELAERGIRVAIDDYGTGNATLDYLKILPADEVKIDRQFVANMDADEKDRILVRSTIEMVHSLGRRVVAEGVETQAELQALTKLGCDVAQGYLIGKPMTFASLVARLAEQETRPAVNQ